MNIRGYIEELQECIRGLDDRAINLEDEYEKALLGEKIYAFKQVIEDLERRIPTEVKEGVLIKLENDRIAIVTDVRPYRIYMRDIKQERIMYEYKDWQDNLKELEIVG